LPLELRSFHIFFSFLDCLSLCSWLFPFPLHSVIFQALSSILLYLQIPRIPRTSGKEGRGGIVGFAFSKSCVTESGAGDSYL
jgi:hypothetical protein